MLARKLPGGLQGRPRYPSRPRAPACPPKRRILPPVVAVIRSISLRVFWLPGVAFAVSILIESEIGGYLERAYIYLYSAQRIRVHGLSKRPRQFKTVLFCSEVMGGSHTSELVRAPQFAFARATMHG